MAVVSIDMVNDCGRSCLRRLGLCARAVGATALGSALAGGLGFFLRHFGGCYGVGGLCGGWMNVLTLIEELMLWRREEMGLTPGDVEHL
jgi:hypothetical protein